MRFLKVQGNRIVDSAGQEVLLAGWGLGNWLLQEGYMWKAPGERFDRPRRIEKCVEELTGKAYAERFWEKYRENYVRREDILAMKELGYNSVRIPFSYRHFMEDGPGIVWKEEGFALLDRCLSWCEEAEIYAFLDLHGAPGGQTGSNIDDSVDNVPRLFMDRDCREKGIALWEKLAQRYHDRAVVGGYDLLNEPIIPPTAGNGDFDYLIPELERFYEETIERIRRVDQAHILSLEGPHWATDVRIFYKKYDDNMVLHFHRYAEPPDTECLARYVEAAERLNVPLWLGETGENKNTWYAALYPLAESMGIGYNIWPWKKMDCTNSPCSIREPKNYQDILRYLDRGPHPGFERARKIFDEYLENVLYENCEHHPEITNHVFRKPPFTVCGVDFDECPGEGISYHAQNAAQKAPDTETEAQERTAGAALYRKNTGMEICELYPKKEPEFSFDCGWDRMALVLKKGEFACYRFRYEKNMIGKLYLTVSLEVRGSAVLLAGIRDGEKTRVLAKNGMQEVTVPLAVAGSAKGEAAAWLEAAEGTIILKELHFLLFEGQEGVLAAHSVRT